MEVENQEDNLSTQVSFSGVEKFTMETMKSIVDSISKISEISQKAKEQLFDGILSMLNDLSRSNILDLIDNFSFEEKEHYFISPFSVKVLKEISNSGGETLSPELKEKQIDIIKIYFNQFIFFMPSSKTATVLQTSTNAIKFLPIWECLVGLLSDTKTFYNPRVKIESDPALRYLETIYPILNPDAEKWRREIKVNDSIDYLLQEKERWCSSERIRYASWTRGTVIAIEPSNDLKIKLWGIDEVHQVPLNSCVILPLGTLSKDYEQRENFQIGDLIDMYDIRSWNIATVVDQKVIVKGDMNYRRIKYGQRIYNVNGNKEDRTGRKYFGCSESLDQEVSVHNPKIKPLHTLTKKIDNWKLSSYPYDSIKFNVLDSFIPFEINGIKLFAIGKSLDNKVVDISYVNLINYFGNCGGFDKLIEAISDTSVITPIYGEYLTQMFSLLIDLISNIASYLHFDFCKTYLDIFIPMCFKFLLEFFLSSENRNFKREKFESLLRKIKDIMSKIYIEKDVSLKYDQFRTSFGIECMRSNMLDKKLIGLKMITEILSDAVKIGGYNSPIIGNTTYDRNTQLGFLMETLKREKFFEMVFEQTSHVQIFKKSGELIKSLANGKLLTELQLAKLYTIASESTDINVKTTILKSLKDNVYNLSYDLKKVLIRMILDSKAKMSQISTIRLQELELLQNLQKYLPACEGTKLYREIGWYFFELLFSASTNELMDSIINEFVSLLRCYDYRDLRAEYMEEILKRLNPSNITFSELIKHLKILRKMMNSLQAQMEERQKVKIFSLIVSEYKIVPLLIESLLSYHLALKDTMFSKDERDLSMNFNLSLSTHDALIIEFFAFMNFTINNSSYCKYYFSMDQITTLFVIFAENQVKVPGVTINEVNILFKFLKDAEEKRLLPEDTFKNIFNHMDSRKEMDFDNVSLDLVKVFWSIFLSINKGNGYITIIEKSPVGKPAASSLSLNADNVISISLNSGYTPHVLEGFELIYRVMVSSPADVCNAIIGSFIQLYVLKNKTPQERGRIYSFIIENAVNTINESICSFTDKDTEITTLKQVNANRILNSLKILRALIEESEKNGTAGIIPHAGINRANVVNIKINAEIMYLPKLPHNLKIFNLCLFTANTIWDLKTCIARKIGLQPEGIGLKNSEGKEFPESSNGKSIEEMKIKKDELLSIFRSPVAECLAHVPLTENGQLTERCKNVLKDIFYSFARSRKPGVEGMESLTSEEMFMSREDCGKYIKRVTDMPYEVSVEDPRILNMFNRYDTDKDDLLTLDNFFQFYLNAIDYEKKLAFAWENIRNFGYRNDLKMLNEPIDQFNYEREYMPRWILSSNITSFKAICDLQEKIERSDHSSISVSTYASLMAESFSFINTICTNQTIYRNILMLDHILTPSDWTLYINEANYTKMLYSLQIIESFFEEFELGNVKVQSDSVDQVILGQEAATMLQPDHKILWLEKFISWGGLEHVLRIFLKFKMEEGYLQKMCFTMLIKIIRSALSIVIRSNTIENSCKEEIVRIIRKDSITPENALNEGDKIDTLVRSHSSEAVQNLLFSRLNDKFEHRLVTGFLYGDEFNYKVITSKLMEMLFAVVKCSQIGNEERHLVTAGNNLLSLVFISLVNLEDMTSFLYDNQNFEMLIICGILINDDQIIRGNFYKTLKNLCRNLIRLGEFQFVIRLLNIVQNTLLKLIQSSNTNERGNCKYLFSLLERIIGLIFAGWEESLCWGTGGSVLTVGTGSEGSKNLLEKINFKFPDMALSIYDSLSLFEHVTEDAMLSGCIKLLIILVKHDQNLKQLFTTKENNLIKLLINKLTLKDNIFPVHHSLKDPGIEFSLVNLEDVDKSILNPSAHGDQIEEIRNHIYDLIISLIENNLQGLLSFFFTKISEFPTMIANKKRSSYYSPSSDKRAMCGYVGIKNLGNICYMNSVLQQFFQIPSFRYGILQINDGLQFTEHADNKDYDDNVLHQLQKLFSFLELSSRVSFSPVEFCWAFKDDTGHRTNISIQQDAQEFLTRFFGRIETATEKTAFKYFLQSMFGGKTCSQVVCKDCGNVNNNFEDFYNLSLEVKNLKTLPESLNKFISEEQIEGYNCSNCKKVTNVSKRNSLAYLPNILIVHLQRILFNYDNLVNEKVNSSLEFHKVLNLKNYCSEELWKNVEKSGEMNDRVYERDSSYYEYILVGVVVHSGHADGGHYFSYINTNRSGTLNTWENDSSKTNWIHFNDAFVSPFNLSTLESNCFGGTKMNNDDMMPISIPSANPPAIGVTQGGMIQQNEFQEHVIYQDQYSQNKYQQNIEFGQSAYMLIYERKTKSPIKFLKNSLEFQGDVIKINDNNRYSILKEFDLFNVDTQDEISMKDLKESLFYDEDKNETFQLVPFYSINKAIPNVYLMEVVNDNIEFNNDQKIFNSKFNEFFAKILGCFEEALQGKFTDYLSPEELNFCFQVILSFLFDVLPKSSNKQHIKEIADKIHNMISRNGNLSSIILSMLNEKKDLVQEILFSTEETANSGYKELIKNAIITNIQIEAINGWTYLNSIPDPRGNISVNETLSTPPPQALILLDNLIDLLPIQLTRSWTKMLSYLELIEELCNTKHPLLIEFFYKKNLMARCIDFFLQSSSPYYSKTDNRQEMGKSGVSVKFAPLFSIIAAMICYYYTTTWNESNFVESIPHTFNNISQSNNIRAFNFTERDEKLLNTFKFYQLGLKENYNNSAIGRILSHMMYNNYEFTKQALYLVMEIMHQGISLVEAKNAFEIISEIVRIDDKFSMIRMEWLFGIPYIQLNFSESLPSLNYKMLGNYVDRLFSYKSYVALYTTYESLAERFLTRYYCSGDFLVILNLFFTEIVFKSEIACCYFESLPHPKPKKNSAFANNSLKSYLLDLANERYTAASTASKQYDNIYALLQTNLLTHENLIASSRAKILSSQEYDLHFSNMNYRPEAILSDVLQLCPNIPTETFNSLSAKEIYLVQIDYEAEYKTEEDINCKGTTIATKLYETNDGIELLRFNRPWADQSEDEVVKRFIENNRKQSKVRRKMRGVVAENAKVAAIIRRFVIANLSGIDYKFRIQFIPSDIATLNTHIPKTEIVIVSRARSQQDVLALYKEDVTKDFGRYTVAIEIVVLKSTSIAYKAGLQKDSCVPVMQLEDNEIGGEKEIMTEEKIKEEEIISNIEEKCQIDCNYCGRSNFFSETDNYICKFCQRNVFS